MKSFPIALAGTLALLYAVSGCSKPGGDLGALATGAMAALKPTSHPEPPPTIPFKDAAGALHTLAEFKGRVTLVNLWANWCPPCKAEIPSLAALAKSHGALFHTDAAQAAGALGWFGAVWALMQLLFSPLLGVLSDRFGRRPVLLISMFGQALDYLLMACSPTLAWLFVFASAVMVIVILVFRRVAERRIRLGIEAQINEDAVVAINIRRTDLLTVHGNDSLALFTGRFCEELLQPCTKV